MKLTMCLLLILVRTISFCQQPIEGLGQFKFGRTTTSVLDEISRQYGGVPVKKVSTNQELYGNSSNQTFSRDQSIKEIVTNTGANEDEPEDGSYCQSLRVFFVQKCSISGLETKAIYFTFDNDTLMRIAALDNHPLAIIFKQKHGAGTEREDMVLTSCQDQNGQLVRKAQSIIEWTSPGARAIRTNGETEDIWCHGHYGPRFIVERTDSAARLAECEYKGRINARKNLDKRREKFLKDF